MRPEVALRAGCACVTAATLGATYAELQQPEHSLAAQMPVQGAPDAPTAKLAGGHVVRYGQRVPVAGRLLSRRSGVPVALEYRPVGEAASASHWTVLARTTTRSGGAYRLAGRFAESGVLQVQEGPVSQPAAAAQTIPAPSAGTYSSAQLPVQVRAAVSTQQRNVDVLPGHRANLTGTVRPALPGRRVALEVHGKHGWHTLTQTGTNGSGGFHLAYTPHQVGSSPTRVRFVGDGANAPAQAADTHLKVYRLVSASWYDLSGSGLACGGTMSSGTMGVADRTLPCGTIVGLHYHGRTVHVPVIDRGPFVAGRELDLTAATKDALGFPDTGEIWTTA